MKSSVIERSSSFENALRLALKEAIADRQPLSDREFANLSAAIRLGAFDISISGKPSTISILLFYSYYRLLLF